MFFRPPPQRPPLLPQMALFWPEHPERRDRPEVWKRRRAGYVCGAQFAAAPAMTRDAPCASVALTSLSGPTPALVAVRPAALSGGSPTGAASPAVPPTTSAFAPSAVSPLLPAPVRPVRPTGPSHPRFLVPSRQPAASFSGGCGRVVTSRSRADAPSSLRALGPTVAAAPVASLAPTAGQGRFSARCSRAVHITQPGLDSF